MAKATSSFSRWPALPDPLRPVFRLLTSIKFALGIIAFMALAGIAGILIPQVPPERRDFPAARAEWLADQKESLGFWYGPLEAIGAFELFATWWFYSGMTVLVIGLAICSSSRWAPIWRNAFRPQRRVPDRYFETARHRQDFANPSAADWDKRVMSTLRSSGYRVEEHERGGVRYLFADRFAWAQMATFVSHLAIVVLLVGGLTSRIFAVNEFTFIPEGGTRPVFDLDSEDHLQLAVDEAVGRFDSEGNPLDFRSELTIFKDGREVASGEATVNDPLEWNGYRLHQTAYSPNGVALRVEEAAGGRPLYSETVVLGGEQISPFLRIVEGGEEIFAENVVLADIVSGGAAIASLITVPGSETIVFVGLRDQDERFVLDLREANPPAGEEPFGATLEPGGSAELGGRTFVYEGLSNVPADLVNGLPGGAGQGAVVQLGRHADGEPYIGITGLGEEGAALKIEEGESEEFGGFRYSFAGTRDFSGITVRKDPGVAFLWVGVAMMLGGLGVTFYTPRRRLWVKLDEDRTYFAGQAAHLVNLEREMRQLAADAGAVGVNVEADEDEDD
ncbi:MAG: cytochrome c biogenesis protein ResB [Dehalococcoidia bacterium]